MLFQPNDEHTYLNQPGKDNSKDTTLMFQEECSFGRGFIQTSDDFGNTEARSHLSCRSEDMMMADAIHKLKIYHSGVFSYRCSPADTTSHVYRLLGLPVQATQKLYETEFRVSYV